MHGTFQLITSSEIQFHIFQQKDQKDHSCQNEFREFVKTQPCYHPIKTGRLSLHIHLRSTKFFSNYIGLAREGTIMFHLRTSAFVTCLAHDVLGPACLSFCLAGASPVLILSHCAHISRGAEYHLALAGVARPLRLLKIPPRVYVGRWFLSLHIIVHRVVDASDACVTPRTNRTDV